MEGESVGNYWSLEVETVHKVFSDTNYLSYNLVCEDIVPPDSIREPKMGNFTVWKRYQEKGFKLYFSLSAPESYEKTLIKANNSSFGFDAESAISRACDKTAIEELISVYVDWMFDKTRFDAVRVKAVESGDTWIELERTNLQAVYIDYTWFHDSCVAVASRREEESRRPISGGDFWDYLNS